MRGIVTSRVIPRAVLGPPDTTSDASDACDAFPRLSQASNKGLDSGASLDYRNMKVLIMTVQGVWAMARLTIEEFLSDKQGSRFIDVAKDPRLDFQTVLDFFNGSARQTRMEDSEKHHDRPALAGVVRELENTEPFKSFFQGYDGHTTRRVRQAIGVVVRMLMEKRGWKKAGRKGSLGQRTKVQARTTTPAAYHNSSGLSWWFTRSERYEKQGETAYPAVGKDAVPGKKRSSRAKS